MHVSRSVREGARGRGVTTITHACEREGAKEHTLSVLLLGCEWFSSLALLKGQPRSLALLERVFDNRRVWTIPLRLTPCISRPQDPVLITLLFAFGPSHCASCCCVRPCLTMLTRHDKSPYLPISHLHGFCCPFLWRPILLNLYLVGEDLFRGPAKG